MAQLNTDTQTRWRKAANLALAILVNAVTVGASASAVAAQVEVVNSVQKVETYVDEQGVAKRRLVGADSVVPGDELRYTISFTNAGDAVVDAGSIVITNPVPTSTQYIDGTAFGSGTEIRFSADQGVTFGADADLKVIKGGIEQLAAAQDYTTIQWQFQPNLAPGETGQVSFNVKLK